MRRVATITITILLFASVLVSSSTTADSENPEGWSEDVRLTYDDAESYDVDIVVDSENNIHRKFDGENWSEDLRLDNPNKGGFYPAITVDSKTIFM